MLEMKKGNSYSDFNVQQPNYGEPSTVNGTAACEYYDGEPLNLFFSDLFNCNYNNHAPILDLARFSCSVTKTITMSSENDRYSNLVQNNVQFQATGLNVRTYDTVSTSSWRGFNVKYINDQGVFVPELAITDFSRTSFDRRLVTLDILSVVKKIDWADNHVGFIYNMLCTWYLAHLGASQKAVYRAGELEEDAGHLNIHFGVSVFKDTHYIVKGNNDFEADHVLELELGLPTDSLTITEARLRDRNKSNYWDAPYILYYNNDNKEAEAFYIYHLFGRKKTKGVNFLIDIPCGPVRDMMLEGSASVPNCNPVLDAKILLKPDTIWSYIMDYVSLNRVEHDFASAFEILTFLAFHPTPSSVEANSWFINSTVEVYLPQFKPSRALIRTCLEGSPYREDDGAESLTKSISVSPHLFVLRAAIYNYYYWYGAYTLIYNEGIGRSDRLSAYNCDSQELQMLKRTCARGFCISALTGRHVFTSFTPTTGALISFTKMARVRFLDDVIPLDPGGNKMDAIRYGINDIFAPVSGVLLDGTVLDSFRTTAHLGSVSQLPTTDNPYAPIARLDVLRLANAYRLFGWDTTCKSIETEADVKPWAPAHEWVIEPASVLRNVSDSKYLRIHASERRAGVSSHVPYYLQVLTSDKPWVLSKTKPEIRITEWKTRRHINTTYIKTYEKPVPVQVRLTGGYTIAYNVLKAVPSPLKTHGSGYEGDHFYDGLHPAPPKHPERHKISANTLEDVQAEEPSGPDASS